MSATQVIFTTSPKGLPPGVLAQVTVGDIFAAAYNHYYQKRERNPVIGNNLTSVNFDLPKWEGIDWEATARELAKMLDDTCDNESLGHFVSVRQVSNDAITLRVATEDFATEIDD